MVGASLLAARLIQVGGDAAIRRLTRTIPGDVDRVVLRSVHPALYATVLAAGGYLGTRLLTTDPGWIDPATATAQTRSIAPWSTASGSERSDDTAAGPVSKGNYAPVAHSLP
ncbi:hypothetical protein HZS55_05575 [Halosimplex rubrum]|uniref:Uncharacterized protein n=1 Tax=Halosimplex rubrum TaxID=869889 RepID=A0A7D5SPL0_9EURY|nr:hypothetical protein [Halosimplex rubrum]QLH76807.1 hypothetical protein HZS55_05575 [Halosimplex rubrum]